MTFRPAARTGSPAGTVRSSPAAINIQRLCIERLLSRSFSPNGMLAPPLASSCNNSITRYMLGELVRAVKMRTHFYADPARLLELRIQQPCWVALLRQLRETAEAADMPGG